MDPFSIGLLLWLVSSPVFLVLYLRARARLKRAQADFEGSKSEHERALAAEVASRQTLEEHFRPILDVEKERARLQEEIADLERQSETVRSTYREKRKLLDQLLAQVAVYDERLSFAELGVYEPHFNFGDSDAYKAVIADARAQQKEMISDKRAMVSTTAWQVGGSAAKGRTMVNRQIRLSLRAFNNECEAAIANTRWNNVNAMERRIRNAATQIDKLNESLSIYVEPTYIELRLKELFLTHEYREALKREKDERAEAARFEREEQKLQRQAEAAARREADYAEMLLAARREAEADSGNGALRARVAELQAELEAAHNETERARAMAELTRSGYVYIISNIGSFGEDVVKIGLTRRLDPDDRVRELGDASVPFAFDTHAMIYSEDAPALEAALHTEFADARINIANMRKEFFRLSLTDVEAAVRRLAPNASFFTDREAQDWHETLARRRETLEVLQLEAEARAGAALPAEI